jgi:hypothetical protein
LGTHQACILCYFRPVLRCYYLGHKNKDQTPIITVQFPENCYIDKGKIIKPNRKKNDHKRFGANGLSFTAAIEGLVSSPGCGCVTSAPKMIVGMSLTSGILLESASTKTVFRPPTCAHGNQEDEVHVKGKDYNHCFPMSRA